jgi:chromate transporter
MAQTETAASSNGENIPSVLEIFLAFSGIAIIGFGGVLPFARHMMVEKRGWLTGKEFAEMLAFSQFLPGGNICNMAVVLGQRFHGALGSLAALTGLMLWPTVIVVTLGSLYTRYADSELLHDALAGMGAGAAGLLLSMVAKMATPLFERGAGVALAFAVLAFICIAVFQLPLVQVLLVIGPLSIGAAWWKIRR